MPCDAAYDRAGPPYPSADCGLTQDEAPATLLDGIARTAYTVGDNVYENGTTTESNDCHGSGEVR